MGDDDELGAVAHPAQILGKACHIGVVQCGLDLVQDAEGRGVDGQNGEVDADGDKRLLAAREGFQVFDDLARRGHPDADAAGKHIALVFQNQAGLAPAEQLGKDPAKVFVDGPEAVREDLPHLAAQVRYHPGQLVFAALHIGHLCAQRVVAGLYFLVLFNGADVHVAKGADLIAQLRHLRPQGRQALKLHTDLLGPAHRQLVFVPELGGGLVVFGLGGGFPLGKAGHLSAQLFPVLSGGAALGQRLRLGLLAAQPLLGRFSDGRFLRGDLSGAVGLGFADGFHLGPAILAALGQCLQLGVQALPPGGGVLCPLFQGRDLALGQLRVLLAAHLFQPLGAHLLGQCPLPGEEGVVPLGQPVQLRRLRVDLFVQRCFLGGGRRCFLQALRPPGAQRFPLGVPGGQRCLGLLQRGLQPLCLGLSPDTVVARRDLLAGGGRQLSLQGVHLLLHLVGLFLRGQAVLLEGGGFAPQLFHLLLAGKDARRALDAAAGEAAPRVDDLPVQRDHLVVVAQGPGRAGGFVDLVHHHDAA